MDEQENPMVAHEDPTPRGLTVAELDALPVDSAVLGSDNGAWQKQPSSHGRWGAHDTAMLTSAELVEEYSPVRSLRVEERPDSAHRTIRFEVDVTDKQIAHGSVAPIVDLLSQAAEGIAAAGFPVRLTANGEPIEL